MNHLDNRGQNMVPRCDLPARFRREEQQGWPQALAAIVAQMGQESGHMSGGLVQGVRKDSLNLLKIGGNGGTQIGDGRMRLGERR
jgi:hypothetical protein